MFGSSSLRQESLHLLGVDDVENRVGRGERFPDTGAGADSAGGHQRGGREPQMRFRVLHLKQRQHDKWVERQSSIEWVRAEAADVVGSTHVVSRDGSEHVVFGASRRAARVRVQAGGAVMSSALNGPTLNERGDSCTAPPPKNRYYSLVHRTDTPQFAHVFRIMTTKPRLSSECAIVKFCL